MTFTECPNINCLAWGESERHPEDCIFDDETAGGFNCEHPECAHAPACIGPEDVPSDRPEDFEQDWHDQAEAMFNSEV